MEQEPRIGWKLFRVRKNGTLGPLFINARQVVPIGEWLEAEEHPTKGFAFRPGWHVTHSPAAPHLSMKGRAWYMVEFLDFEVHDRPLSQGGRWYTANQMRVIRPATKLEQVEAMQDLLK